MPFMSPAERAEASAIASLAYCNPFLPERIAYERAVLGDEFVASDEVWSMRAGRPVQNANVERTQRRAERLAGALRERLLAGARAAADEVRLFEDVVLYVLYNRYALALWEVIEHDTGHERIAAWSRFRDDAELLLSAPGVAPRTRRDVAALFAEIYQVRRAFHHIFSTIVGGSMPAARLRATVWQSIFTHDMRRYRRALIDRMGDVTTLVVGPSGTGKELVARAIALSRYVPFDPEAGRFAEHGLTLFHPLNLSALSPTLIESELFGHRRGAFTGALADRAGWLEECAPLGSVFLDEIGDVDASIQVKLLRVLQTRTFERLGDTKPLRFRGKIIAATNRDLPREIEAGRLRGDFYYRLCADMISTPSLAEQLHDATDELPHLVRFIATSIVGVGEAEALVGEVVEWIGRHLGPGYAWPGNVRELEQCVRNVLIRREYRPATLAASNERDAFLAAVANGTMTADELLGRYCAIVYAQTGSYQETARRLGIDRRTVRNKVDPPKAKPKATRAARR